jgi:hypothetical protein
MNSIAHVKIGNRLYYADGSIEKNGNRWTQLALDDEIVAQLREQGLEWQPAVLDEESPKHIRKGGGTWRESEETTEEDCARLEAELEVKKAKWVLVRDAAFQQWQINIWRSTILAAWMNYLPIPHDTCRHCKSGNKKRDAHGMK